MKHDDAFEALVLANPINDADAYVDQMAAPTPFLTTTMERIHKMDTLEREPKPADNKNRWRLAAAAIGAATVVAALVVMTAALLDSDDQALSPASSDSPHYVEIEVTPNDDANGGTFTATGAGVCSSGATTTRDWGVTDTQWWYVQEFLCADFTGSFLLRSELPPPSSEPATVQGTWAKVGGDFSYADAVASGTMTATPPGLTVKLPGPVGFVPDTGMVTYKGEMTPNEGGSGG